ncbi:hemolysin family protein [Candidatus Raskinella chloraquaticus]|uniref:CBS domain-containing protein n=1 Tax=Candidatus Raskinella chloraquaticus TaxID=1951219 RepID=A0A1W9HZD0_9HYPH|nr:MAG: hypothetical protein A4S15_07510 [Proteobacteria bacterium SG_bin8]
MSISDDDPDQPPPPAARRRLLDRLKSALRMKKEVSLRADLEGALAEDLQTETPDQTFSPEERAMLRNILGLREVRVADVMIPRADIISIEQDITLGDLLKLFREAAHSRLPVYRQTLDDPIGFIHIRDVLSYLIAGAPPKSSTRRRKAASELDLGKIDLGGKLATAKLMRRLLFVPPSMPALDLLVRMQATRVHLALVVDEYGGTDGLVSIEDLIEQVVGDIADEHDEDIDVIAVDKDGWVASARAPLEDVVKALAPDLVLETPPDMEEDIDTLGGLLTALVGRVPARGELIQGPRDIEFEVLDADPRRIKRVRIRKASRRANEPPIRPRRERADKILPSPAGEVGASSAPASIGNDAADNATSMAMMASSMPAAITKEPAGEK